MDFNALDAISPVDGRYRSKTEKLAQYFSEAALIRYRIKVEVEYFIALCEIPLPQLKEVDYKSFKKLRCLYEKFDAQQAIRVKEIEKITNHDVKAVEYYLKEAFDDLGLAEFKEFIHFGLTSQDINNTAMPLMLKDAASFVVLPKIKEVLLTLNQLSEEWIDVPMLARTHGQPASPTRLGKEIHVFIERLLEQFDYFRIIPYAAKFGGATGNFNAHKVAYPNINWIGFGTQFVENILGLYRSHTTTQIEHYDHLAAFFDNLRRINNILLDLSRDMWTYISMDYFKQKIKKGEVGSSAMPHKVNPIDFENAEGNIGIANALFDHLSNKLPVSRLQRDLTDSTVTRAIGLPVAHSFIAFESLLKGLNKLIINKDKIHQDLENNWAVVAEAIQTILRRELYPKPYEALKELTRTNTKITKESISNFIDGLETSDEVKEELKRISPHNYLGMFYPKDVE